MDVGTQYSKQRQATSEGHGPDDPTPPAQHPADVSTPDEVHSMSGV